MEQQEQKENLAYWAYLGLPVGIRLTFSFWPLGKFGR